VAATPAVERAIDLSRPDWAARLKAGESLLPPLPWLNQAEAARAVGIFNLLRLADVPGTPPMREAAGDWFREIVAALFGSVTPQGERRIRELFLLVPKKNGKTSYGALVMLTALLLNRRPHAPFILTAPVQDVTDIAFTAIAGAINLDPVLTKKLHIREHIKTIVHRETKAELQVMTFEPATLTGQKVAGALIDELHVVARMNKAGSAIRQLRGGMLPYPEAFLAFITTQSEEAPSGVFRAELLKARAIRDGERDGAMLPVLYEFPPEMQTDANQWRDPDHWRMVTPNAGRSVTIPRLVEEFKVAEATSDPELRAWASQHLNVEIGLALQSDRWIGADFWERNALRVTLEDLLARCEVITAGIDGGGLDDLLGLAFLGREEQGGNWLLWTHAWAHPQVLERRKSEAPLLHDLQADGDLTLVDMIGEDVEQLAALVEKVEKSGLLDRVGVDNAGIGAIYDALEKMIGHDRIVAIPQGWRLMSAIKTTERKLAEGALKHGGQRLMSWAVGNAKVEPRGNAIYITKQASGTAKIDPLMACFDAVALMAQDPQPRKKKYQMFMVTPQKSPQARSARR
jgi:phage terminase large subunit-like protein